VVSVDPSWANGFDGSLLPLQADEKKHKPSLKLSASWHLKMDGWKMISFLLGWPIFWQVLLLLVSGSENALHIRDLREVFVKPPPQRNQSSFEYVSFPQMSYC